MQFLLLGVNHNTAPLAVRESLALTGEEVACCLSGLKEEQFFIEGFILSTCNRSEFYVLTGDALTAVEGVCRLTREMKGVDHLADTRLRYRKTDREAVEHIFRVISGLDSMVLGEPQIIGQVKEAYSRACKAKSTGAFVNKLCHLAFRVAKRSRSETHIGEGAVSVGFAAVNSVKDRLGGLEGRTILVVGAGNHGELVCRHLESQKIGRLLISSRTAGRARELASRMGAEAVELETLSAALGEVDAVICCTASLRPVITAEHLDPALQRRNGAPLLLVDIAVPRDIDPHLGKRPAVTLLDIDGLTRVVDENLERRREAVPAVEALVRHELDKFFAWYRSLQTVPVIQALLAKMEAIRREEMDRFGAMLEPGKRERVERFSRRLVSRIISDPLNRIKVCDRSTRIGLLKLDTVLDIFALAEENHPDLEATSEREVGG
jgi:glutamyl-tRNA reductase